MPTTSHRRAGAPPTARTSSAWPARIAAFDIGLMFMGSTLVAPLYGSWRASFGLSALTLTLVYATYVVGNVLALLFLGRLSDQVGRRRASLPELALLGVAMLVFAGARSVAWLVLGRALTGLAVGVASGTVNAWLSRGASQALAQDVFAAMVVLLALAAIATGLRWIPRDEA